MGRSVSKHRNSIQTFFMHFECEDESDSQYEWECFMGDLKDNVLPCIFPSLTPCDRWQDREDHVIAENGRCEISVSEYCGCVAICLAPLDPDSTFDVAWCENVAANFQRKLTKFYPKSAMVKQGTMSNGESVYQKVNP